MRSKLAEEGRKALIADTKRLTPEERLRAFARHSFGNRIDLLVGIRGFDPAAFSRTVEVAFEGESLRFVGLEDFIAMKVFAGGPQDLADAKGALETAGNGLDVDLLLGLAKRYGTEATQSLEGLLEGRAGDLDSGADFR
jgi:hypothetical protein